MIKRTIGQGTGNRCWAADAQELVTKESAARPETEPIRLCPADIRAAIESKDPIVEWYWRAPRRAIKNGQPIVRWHRERQAIHLQKSDWQSWPRPTDNQSAHGEATTIIVPRMSHSEKTIHVILFYSEFLKFGKTELQWRRADFNELQNPLKDNQPRIATSTLTFPPALTIDGISGDVEIFCNRACGQPGILWTPQPAFQAARPNAEFLFFDVSIFAACGLEKFLAAAAKAVRRRWKNDDRAKAARSRR